MSIKWMITIVPTELLEQLEKKLATVHALDLMITRIKEYSECKNSFSSDLTSMHIRVEIFADEVGAEAIANTIVEAGGSTVPDAGTVAAVSIEKLLYLHIESR